MKNSIAYIYPRAVDRHVARQRLGHLADAGPPEQPEQHHVAYALTPDAQPVLSTVGISSIV